MTNRTIENVTYRRYRLFWREMGKRRQLTVWPPYPSAGDIIRALQEYEACPDTNVRVVEV